MDVVVRRDMVECGEVGMLDGGDVGINLAHHYAQRVELGVLMPQWCPVLIMLQLGEVELPDESDVGVSLVGGLVMGGLLPAAGGEDVVMLALVVVVVVFILLLHHLLRAPCS